MKEMTMEFVPLKSMTAFPNLAWVQFVQFHEIQTSPDKMKIEIVLNGGATRWMDVSKAEADNLRNRLQEMVWTKPGTAVQQPIKAEPKAGFSAHREWI
jgi:hypothetical protein